MIPKKSKLRVAPFNVPFVRRRQTCAVFLWLISLPSTIALFLISCTIPFFWPFVIAYSLFVLFDIAPENGGRRSNFCRRLQLWKWYADFFPVSLVKQAELDPKKNYIFGYHPHGIISVGAWTNFCTEANNVSEVFPGVTINMLMLTSNFNIPLYRDFFMAHGLCSVSRQSCVNILEKGPGNSILIVVGGAFESLSARPGVYNLILKKRLGFIKLALSKGADLVPVFSFGENDIWDQVNNESNSFVFKLQSIVHKASGVTIPLFHGRGIFNYEWGLLPHRRPIVTVVGKPISVKQNDNPTNEEVLELQNQYINGLFEIWDQYKDVYAKDRVSDLTLVE
ncbi:1957_t:CDS:2 [Ambispora gerdemannii]|uniref:Diacylglycerol O-acyltransferase n=1 Tax=Ambispora gerdemannii TaxID=144530 RepID=A0A9N8Z353_9GLOM|nr:1957_t:CDS:2 [Ambispora gerdemannii]